MSNESVSQSHLTDFVQVGMRVVLRSHLPAAEITPGGPTLTDVVGDVVSLDDEGITLTTRRGEVTVARAGVVAAKQIPPAPPRRRPRSAPPSPPPSPPPPPPRVTTASSPIAGEISPSLDRLTVTHEAGVDTSVIGIDDLQVLMTGGMPPLHTHRIGDWLLRAADGYTGRANSALPTGDPGAPAEDAIEEVRAWYAGQGRSALIQLPHPLGLDPVDSQLGSLLAQRNWRFFMRTLVMTKTASARGMDRAMHIDVHDEPVSDWWKTASPRALEHRDTLTAMLALIPDASYLTAYRNGAPVGHARVAFSAGWSGIFDVHTVPEARHHGVARALLTSAERAAHDRRIPLQYLQVAADNVAAVQLYESLGWQTHHEYHYAAFRR